MQLKLFVAIKHQEKPTVLSVCNDFKQIIPEYIVPTFFMPVYSVVCAKCKTRDITVLVKVNLDFKVTIFSVCVAITFFVICVKLLKVF